MQVQEKMCDNHGIYEIESRNIRIKPDRSRIVIRYKPEHNQIDPYDTRCPLFFPMVEEEHTNYTLTLKNDGCAYFFIKKFDESALFSMDKDGNIDGDFGMLAPEEEDQMISTLKDPRLAALFKLLKK
jgi:hypothetical protein